ncbi:H/ACA ribonucleoprotein complex subunit 2-like protein isoform X2 [Henckelia pumila]|uniref:H/ACA ribonucleoprotein complex subunit 2-like protein isoform X2 n=1 Tax=Henckelia pumila TaxID=405737 RepID=UPI003C6DC0F4
MGSDSETEKSQQKEREKKKQLALAPIAKPLAGKKLCKRTLKLVRRAAEHKCLKRGVKEVVKSIRRGNKGLCVIAGNISPIDVITHVPILCEEANIPYVYVQSKELDVETIKLWQMGLSCQHTTNFRQSLHHSSLLLPLYSPAFVLYSMHDIFHCH